MNQNETIKKLTMFVQCLNWVGHVEMSDFDLEWMCREIVKGFISQRYQEIPVITTTATGILNIPIEREKKG